MSYFLIAVPVYRNTAVTEDGNQLNVVFCLIYAHYHYRIGTAGERVLISCINAEKRYVYNISLSVFVCYIIRYAEIVFIYVLFKTAPHSENKGAGDSSE